MAGYRLRYIYGPVQSLVISMGYEGATLLDLMERLKAIEAAVLEAENARAEAENERRTTEDAANSPRR